MLNMKREEHLFVIKDEEQNPKESSGCISTSIFIPHNTLTIKERIVYDNG